MSNITIILTVFNSNKRELNRWIYDYKKYSKLLNFQILVDNPHYWGLDILERNICQKDLFVNSVNKQKFRTIYDHIQNGNVPTTHFKVMDPDDYIDFNSLSKMDCTNKNAIYLLKSSSFARKPLIENSLFIKIKLTKGKKPSLTFANNWTILPVENLLKDTKFNTKKTIESDDDKLLGAIAMANGATYEFINKSVVYYIKSNGVTALKNFPDFIKNSLYTNIEIMNIISISKYKNFQEQAKTILWLRKRVKKFIRSKYYKCLSIREKENFYKNFKKLENILIKNHIND